MLLSVASPFTLATRRLFDSAIEVVGLCPGPGRWTFRVYADPPTALSVMYTWATRRPISVIFLTTAADDVQERAAPFWPCFIIYMVKKPYLMYTCLVYGSV